ncbi:hypothetical protein IGI57_001352 [Enterococcus sp. DIV0213j]|jgi:uncharacterized protein YpmS
MTEKEPEKRVSKKTPKQASKKPFRESMRNPWKIACLVLIGLILGTGIFLGTRIFANREPDYKEIPAITARQGEPVLTINTKKEKVNQLITFFLEDFQKDSDVKYKFYLENEALLNGEFEILGFPINFYLYFDPYVMENGNVQLKAKSLSVGTLSLPIKDIMNMIKRNYKLPDWIEINTDDLTVMIRLDQFRMQNGMYIKAERINLVDDDIQFSLYLPKTNDTDNTTTTETTESN